MCTYIKLSVFCLLLFLKNSSSQSIASCVSKENCGLCIREPGCVWCSNPIIGQDNSTSTTRCIHKTLIKEDWCFNTGIINNETSEIIIENAPIETSKGKTAVQISPQKIHLKLRRGEEHTLHFKYAQAEDYPVDLYYIMDLSASMEKHREALSSLGNLLAETMTNLTSNFKLGFGSFVDKPEMPFVSTVPSLKVSPCNFKKKNGEILACAPPYGYRNHLSLTENTETFSKEVNAAKVSGNLDAPEGGLDAMMQAIVCKEQIKWRPNARHLLVFSTDAGFHIAGDGKLAGIVLPNDGLCHMENNEYSYTLVQDYPSIGKINEKAIENNVNIIFAVVESVYDIYDDLRKRLKESSIGTLSGDSSNVVNLVRDVYSKIVDSVQISDNFENFMDVKYYSDCNNITNENTNECHNLHVGSVVDFTATIKMIDCPSNGNFTRTYQIKPGALNETLTIEIEMLCECACEKAGNVGFEHLSKDCTGGGNLTCGICQCEEGKFGTKCECDGQTAIGIEDDTNCRNNTADVCSGLGTCKCGKCECNKRTNPLEIISGKFCQCNNFSCKRNGGLLCSGTTRGTCSCGKCSCLSGWEGSACECSKNQNTCVEPGKNKTEICSQKGDCVCGQCQCKTIDGNSYSGKYCQECLSCPEGKCTELRSCVECKLQQKFNGTESMDNENECIEKCGIYNNRVNITDYINEEETENEKICRFPVEGCIYLFKYIYDENKDLNIFVQETKICTAAVDVLAVVSGVIGSILLAGLILLVMWKILTSIHDRREYAKFENEQKSAKWDRGENPLFKNPTSHFNNPTYQN